MQYSFWRMINGCNIITNSKQYEFVRHKIESISRNDFKTGKRISNRKNKVIAKNTITGKTELIKKTIFDLDTTYVGISTGVKRSLEHRSAISKAQKNHVKSDKLRQAASDVCNNILIYNRVCCLCCQKIFDLGNFQKHILGISNKGLKKSPEFCKIQSEKTKARIEKIGACYNIYLITYNNIEMLCYNLWEFFERVGVSPPTGRKRFKSKKVGIHRKGYIISCDVDIHNYESIDFQTIIS